MTEQPDGDAAAKTPSRIATRKSVRRSFPPAEFAPLTKARPLFSGCPRAVRFQPTGRCSSVLARLAYAEAARERPAGLQPRSTPGAKAGVRRHPPAAPEGQSARRPAILRPATQPKAPDTPCPRPFHAHARAATLATARGESLQQWQ